ncbi:hypothetical protein D3C75_711610 [compost metagenome]
MNADHSVVGQLSNGTAAVIAHMQQEAAHSIEDIPVRFNDLCFAANHKYKSSFNRSRFAACHRGIKEAGAAFFHRCSNFFNQSGGNSAGVDDYGSWLKGGQYAVLTVENLTDRIIVADHGNNNILALCSSLWSSSRLGPFFFQRLAFRSRAVIYRNLKSAFQQIGGHRSTHCSESDKADLFHSIFHLHSLSSL